MKSLTIQDLAVVRELDVEFQSGLTILTGETGAGKSILIEALGLALGDRADAAMVRSGAHKASISACFDITGNNALFNLLRDNAIVDGDECLLRRVLNADGGSRAFCNVTPVSAQLLRRIGELLVDIHGQHAHQSLLRPAIQRQILDEFGGLDKFTAAVRERYNHWTAIAQQIARLDAIATDIPSRIDLLRFQVTELSALDLSADALAKLETEHRRAAHAARLAEAFTMATAAAFSSEHSASSATLAAAEHLRAFSDIDPKIATVVGLLEQAAIHLGEAEDELSRLADELEVDPARLQAIEHELQTIHDIARKHRVAAAGLPQRLDEMQNELEQLTARDADLTGLEAELAAARSAYETAAEALHAARRRVAQRMSRDITERLPALGLKHGKFLVEVEQRSSEPSPLGLDEVAFLVTTNPDQAARPLNKVASGGELSRISLAIQVASSGESGTPVLVFDEVDAGIGGPTADVVSRYLCSLATRQQVLCITHLPQVAAAGDEHLTISKRVERGTTQTSVTHLSQAERVDEIARMLGGQKITDAARDHARELLDYLPPRAVS